jgi:hypothetical protein
VISSSGKPVSAKQNLSPLSRCLAAFRKLFGFALLLLAPHARAESLEDAAHDLAMKVCLAGHKQPVKVAWTESTSSSNELSEAVRKVFLDQVSACGMEAAEGSEAPVLTVAARFTPSKILLVANFATPIAGEQLLVAEVPRASLFVARETSVAPQLRAELFWRQEKPIQSAIAWQDPDTQQQFLFVWGDVLLRLRFEGGAWKLIDSAELPGTGRRSRFGEGGLAYSRLKQRLELVVRKKVCDLNLAGHISLACSGSETAERTAQLSSACEESPRYLATGKRDYTQPDRITLGAVSASAVVPSSFASSDESSWGSVDMPGPVLDISVAESAKAAFAVVRNLLTGNYEVYRITAVCGN